MSQTHSRNGECTIVVIGAGIIGLTTALKLQDLLAQQNARPPPTNILIASREWPTSIPGTPVSASADYASMWAGAHMRPIPATTPQLRREAKWLKATAAQLAAHLEAEPWAGIRSILGIEYLEAPGPDYTRQDAGSFAAETGLPGYRKYAAGELPEGVALGYEYQTYCINAPLYCSHLLRKFIVQGGKTVQRDLKSEWEAFSLAADVKLVVNASGMGFGDPKSFPIRGQTALTNLTAADKTITRQNRDGTWSFVIPRSFNGGTVIGGTKDLGDWRLEASAETRQRLLAAAASIIPEACPPDSDKRYAAGSSEIKVIKDVVGRRPAREGGMRIEVEEQGKHQVIHAYGAGGRGYELSWGIADEVAGLAKEVLSSSSSQGLKSHL